MEFSANRNEAVFQHCLCQGQVQIGPSCPLFFFLSAFAFFLSCLFLIAVSFLFLPFSLYICWTSCSLGSFLLPHFGAVHMLGICASSCPRVSCVFLSFYFPCVIICLPCVIICLSLSPLFVSLCQYLCIIASYACQWRRLMDIF